MADPIKSPSPITCAKCGKRVMWVQVTPNAEDWWLDIPCECGSELFNVEVARPRLHCILYGINV